MRFLGLTSAQMRKRSLVDERWTRRRRKWGFLKVDVEGGFETTRVIGEETTDRPSLQVQARHILDAKHDLRPRSVSAAFPLVRMADWLRGRTTRPRVPKNEQGDKWSPSQNFTNRLKIA